MSNSNITPKKRFLLALLWSIITILFCYISLYLTLTFLGTDPTAELISGDIYTFMPAIMAVVFIFAFKTDTINLEQFSNPGLKWLSFGVFYTILVLSLTIITDYLIGGLKYNTNYSPFKETVDLAGFSTGIQALDFIFFFVIVGTLLLFSPGGFVRIIGEEAGWRGYLFPELLKLHPKLSLVVSTFIVGLVWFSFHIPYFTVLAPVTSDKIPYLLLGSIGVFFGANWAMTWAYLKTKNLWPAMMLHYSWNLANPVFTGNLYDKSLGLLNPSINNLWLINGEGLVGGTFHFLVGLFFLFLIIRDRDKLFEGYKSLDNEVTLTQKKLPKRIKISQ